MQEAKTKALISCAVTVTAPPLLVKTLWYIIILKMADRITFDSIFHIAIHVPVYEP